MLGASSPEAKAKAKPRSGYHRMYYLKRKAKKKGLKKKLPQVAVSDLAKQDFKEHFPRM